MSARLTSASASEIEATAARWVARRDAGLLPSGEAELRRWLDADPRHAEALAFLDSTWSVLAKPARAGVAGELEAELHTLSRDRRRRRRALVAGSAMALVLAFGVARWTPEATDGASPDVAAVVLLPTKQTLPDGSVVELRGNARVAVDFSPAFRRITLEQGVAHFEVVKDPARPFVVSAGGVDVRAVGTAFLVELGAEAVDVVVTSGQVAVDHRPSASGAPSPQAVPLATIAAGRGVRLEQPAPDVAPAVQDIPLTELSERLAWRAPRLEFTRTPLGEAVTLLNRYAGPGSARLFVADTAAANLRITGIFRADNTAAFVHLLEGGFGVKAETNGQTITLRMAQ